MSSKSPLQILLSLPSLSPSISSLQSSLIPHLPTPCPKLILTLRFPTSILSAPRTSTFHPLSRLVSKIYDLLDKEFEKRGEDERVRMWEECEIMVEGLEGWRGGEGFKLIEIKEVEEIETEEIHHRQNNRQSL
jgi:hypothetical protein